MNVRREHRSPDRIVDGRECANRIQIEDACNARHRERERRGRQDPPRASRVEVGERHATRVEGAAEQPLRDQEARDHEEHVDADEAAAQTGNARVAERDDQDGDGAKSLDVRTKRGGRARPSHGRGRVTCNETRRFHPADSRARF